MTLLEMYESGMSTSQIAQKLGINPTTVRSRMKKEGIKLRSPGGTCTFNVDEAIQLYKQGNTLQQVAVLMNVQHSAIYEQFKKREVDTSKVQYDYQQIVDMLEAQDTKDHICDSLGISTSHLNKIIREHKAK